jgi:hypothetical protein
MVVASLAAVVMAGDGAHPAAVVNFGKNPK